MVQHNLSIAVLPTVPPPYTEGDMKFLRLVIHRLKVAKALKRAGGHGFVIMSTKSFKRLDILAGSPKGYINYWDKVRPELRQEYRADRKHVANLIKTVQRIRQQREALREALREAATTSTVTDL